MILRLVAEQKRQCGHWMILYPLLVLPRQGTSVRPRSRIISSRRSRSGDLEGNNLYSVDRIFPIGASLLVTHSLPTQHRSRTMMHTVGCWVGGFALFRKACFVVQDKKVTSYIPKQSDHAIRLFFLISYPQLSIQRCGKNKNKNQISTG